MLERIGHFLESRDQSKHLASIPNRKKEHDLRNFLVHISKPFQVYDQEVLFIFLPKKKALKFFQPEYLILLSATTPRYSLTKIPSSSYT